ncbi:MAG: FHA domain-containing protein [Armatimonadia bacterium]|nr:FHA domain-containing protein [Armatimonadia bacterium]
MKPGRAFWVARVTGLAALMVFGACPVLAETVEVAAPDEIGGRVVAGPLTPSGFEPTLEQAVEPGGAVEVELPDEVPPRYLLCFHASDERIWRTVLLPEDRQECNSRYGLTAADLYEPAEVTVVVNRPAWGRIYMVDVLLREADDVSRSMQLEATDERMAIELDDVRPGIVQVYAISDTGLEATDMFRAEAGESTIRHLTLLREATAPTEGTPLFGGGGDVSSDLYTAVSVAVFGLVVLIWLVVGGSFPLVWSFFGLRQGLSRGVLSITAAIIGILLLGNGIAMFLLQQVRYMPLVSAMAAAQLVLLSTCLLAYVSRRAWTRSLAILGLVFTMVASLAFLPTFAFEGDDADIGIWLTRVEVVLVCVASIALIISVMVDRRRRAPSEASRDTCPTCGQTPDPVSGRCGCPPLEVGEPGPRIARLSVLHADGTRADLSLGPKTLIGSAPECDVPLRDEPAAEERHAVIEDREGVVYVRDLGTRAGTLVNGVAAAEQELSDGDELCIGETFMFVELVEPASRDA